MIDEPLVPAQQPTTYDDVQSGSKAEPRAVSVKQPTKHPTQKVSAMAYGGGGLAIVINWLRARWGIEFIAEDIELILLIGAVGAGYFTRERRL